MDHRVMSSTPTLKPASLYLRPNGTLLVTVGDREIEVQLAPPQCLELAVNLLRLAVRLQPNLAGEVAEVLSRTIIEEEPPCPSSQH